jgi:hypothetical protein
VIRIKKALDRSVEREGQRRGSWLFSKSRHARVRVLRLYK